MIRRLNADDYISCMKLVKERPAENLFIISDIETFGFEEDFQEVWGDFDDQNKLRAILLNYEGNFIAYSSGEFDAEGFALTFSNSRKAIMLSGLDHITSAIIPFVQIPLYRSRKLYYAKCESTAKLQSVSTSLVKQASIEDCYRITDLYNQIDEFDRPSSANERIRNMEKGVSRTYFIEDNEKIVSAVSTTAENQYSAMVVGVCTLDTYKNRGFATQCLHKLSQDLLGEGKSLCLFYDNPKAGRIYKRLGFEDMAMWTMTMIK
ncbi:GNAT family N-acetyltransferase [Halalkalibacter kiskunsagensis]|uniref:GNAT family N-acetyltransferase n=1 Tax=Halalkalibacter kiskunsagensis TaxID=1548599 RepID=A0ABV6KC81_9BACI